MNFKECCKWAIPSLLLAVGAAYAGTPDVDGDLETTEYGSTPLVVQKASVISILSDPFSLELNANNSNVGGVGLLAAGDFVTPANTVFTGLEICVPLAETGWTGGPIRIAHFINGGGSDFLSNQVLGGLGAGAPNLGSPPFDFADDVLDPNVAGDQFVTVAEVRSNEAVTIDGILAENYGTALYVNTQNPTNFGDNTESGPIVANGSEIDQFFAFRDDLGTPSTADDLLYIFSAGNFETNGNKIEFFLDVGSGGTFADQNPLAAPANPNFAGLSAMAGSVFDVGFAPDYYIRYNTFAFGDPTGFGHVIDAVLLGDSGNFGIAGRSTTVVATGPNGFDIEANLNNSNIAGVSSPGGGVGPDSSFVTDPATVTTGLEFKIDLDAIGFDGTGYDGAGNIALGGFIRTGNLIFNQVIGGLPNDTNNIGRADGVDFNNFAGNQFAVLSSTPVAGAITIDGTLDGGYGSAIYVNNNGGTGNSVSPQLNDDATDPLVGADGNPAGSEIDALYAAVRNEMGTNFLYVFVAGNFGQFHRTSIFIDAIQGEGQNSMRGDNPTIDNIGDNNLNALFGLTWDTGFAPDFIVQHHLGEDGTTMLVNHFADGAQLLTLGGSDPADQPQGGRFDGGLKSSTNLVGDLVNRTGFGNNTDSSFEEANGSELNGLFATTDGTYLYLLVTGNLENNFTKLDIFFDIIPGRGQNTLIWDGDPVTGEPTPAEILSNPNDPSSPLVPNPAYVGNPPLDDPNMFQQMGGPFPNVGSDPPTFQPGLTFDAPFLADHAIYLTNGNLGAVVPGEREIFGGFARLRDALPSADVIGGGTDPGFSIFWGQTRTSSLGFFEQGDRGLAELAIAAINNTNIGGVSGGPYFFGDVSDAPNVTTGMEIAIPLADIEIPDGTTAPVAWDGTTPFKVIVILNGGSHSFVSNQILPHICSPELGNVREVNFQSDHPGDQFLALSWNGTDYTVTNTGTLPPDCVEPIGACCVGTSCSVELQSECEQVLGGTFLGDGTDCTGDPCTPTGACCFGTLCQDDFTEADCIANSGTYAGDGVLCSSDPCASTEPTGSCVFACSGGSTLPCFEDTSANCATAGGIYLGDNTTCANENESFICAGDISGDNITNLADFNVLAVNFGSGPGATRATGDLNCDGFVNLADFNILAVDFGCNKTALFP